MPDELACRICGATFWLPCEHGYGEWRSQADGHYEPEPENNSKRNTPSK